MSTFTESQDMNGNVSESNKNMEESSTQNNEFSRKTIEKLGSSVRLTDSDDKGLELYCYVNCSAEDDPDLHKCRGVVFNGNNIVMKAFPYTVEYRHTETEQLKNSVENHFTDCSFYDSHEGSLVRMFFFDGKWYTSTHRKLDAFKSKWASKESFGTCFKRALEAEVEKNSELRDALPQNDQSLLERFQSTLDQSKQYMFLISHTEENRIVCLPPESPVVYHVGTFVNSELVMTEKCRIPYPRKHDFLNMESLIDYVSNIDIRNLQGVICFAPNNKQYKIVQTDYMDLFNARGNEPSIKFRYLQVRMIPKTLNMLFYLYPDMVPTFNDIENIIYDISKKIYSAYVQRFIKKCFVTVPVEDFAIIRECHKWHEEDRIKNRINLDKVIDIINKQNPTAINHMIRSHKLENDPKNAEKKTKPIIVPLKRLVK